MDTEKTIVVFRKFRKEGDIIAMFPLINADNNKGACMSYQHIGQHGAASYDLVNAYTIPALEREYTELKKELESIGYNLKIQKRIIKKWFQCIPEAI